MHVYANKLELTTHWNVSQPSLSSPAQASMACNNIVHKNIYFSLGIILHMLLFANILAADLRIQANTLLHELALLCISCEIEAFLSPYPCRFFFFSFTGVHAVTHFVRKEISFPFLQYLGFVRQWREKGEAHSHRIWPAEVI